MQTTFKKGHKFDILDMFTISPSEVQELFWKEFWSKVDKKKPNLDNLKVMLESGLVDLEAKGKYGYTPLHVATENDSLELAELLISSGADVDAKDEWGETPLHKAAMNDSLEIVQLLISSGADVNAKDDGGRTLLYLATENDSLAVAKLLISSGADVNAKSNDGLPLLHEAEVNAKGYNGWTPLDWAAWYNHLELAELLFKHSSKKNREYVLNRYRKRGHKTLVKLLEKLKV